MPEFPDEKENREKDFILARNPFLRVFIDPVLEVDKDEWLQRMSDLYETKVGEMIEAVGAMEVEKRIKALEKKATLDGSFPPDTDEIQKDNLVKTLTLIGYEVGREGEVMSFFGEIYDRLIQFRMLEYSGFSADFAYLALYRGVKWRENSVSASDKNRLKIFDDFLKGVDFK